MLDLFDRQRSVITKRATDLARPSSRDHVEHILPSDQGFLVHLRESFRFTPFETASIIETVLNSINVAGPPFRDGETRRSLEFFSGSGLA